MTYVDVIEALAVPTRRDIVERLRRKPMSVQELTDCLPVSQAAVSQHLKALRGAGLVDMERVGTSHVYRLRARGLDSLRRYLDRFWDEVLDAYAGSDSRTRRRKR